MQVGIIILFDELNVNQMEMMQIGMIICFVS